MKQLLNKITKHASHVVSHTKKHKQQYLFGTFWSFAIIKMVLLFAAFFGVMQISNRTYAQVNGELNSSNIGTYCAIWVTNCDLTYKGITSIAENTFVWYTNLVNLYLSNNPITSIEGWDFNWLPNLQYISIQDAPVASIASDTFSWLSSIKYIFFNNNQITSIAPGTFNWISTLLQLTLSANQITSIAPGTFGWLSNLTKLFLSYNQIASLPETLPTEVPNITNGLLQVHHNKLCTWSWSSTLLNFLSTKAGWAINLLPQDTSACPIPGWELGINNNAASTTDVNVTLNISGTLLTNMQFQNDTTGGTRSSLEAFSTTKAWTLSAGTGLKTVYAQFNTGTLSSSYSILYEPGTGCVGSSCADITLQIIANESWYCEIGDSVNFGLTWYSASSRVLQSAFPTTSGNTPWFCNDMQGNGTTRNLSIQSSDLLNVFTNNPSHTIAWSNVSIKNPAAAVVQWACTPNPGSSLNARTPIGVDTPILWKIGGIGEVCKIQTSQVDLQINIPAYQAVGQYSGTLTITVPSWI